MVPAMEMGNDSIGEFPHKLRERYPRMIGKRTRGILLWDFHTYFGR
jgi:hypothetical protein